MKPSNGTGLPNLLDNPPDTDPPPSDPVTTLRAEVIDLRSEVRLGFAGVHQAIESLRQRDADHDIEIGSLWRRYATIGGLLLTGGTAGSLLYHFLASVLGLGR